MKFPLMILLLCAGMLAQSKEAARPAGLPAGAAAVDSTTWRWVDKQGKAWLYRSTPFGVMRSEEPAKKAEARPKDVPADAVNVREGVWRRVDEKKVAWLYQVTPAGVMKAKETAVDETADEAVLALITVKEEGDVLRFSRPGPFGTYSWTKKKDALNRDETLVWERSRAAIAAGK